MKSDIQSILFTEQQIADRIRCLGEQITKDYQNKEVVLIAVLKGSFIFMADLARQIALPVEVDFMTVSSYGNDTKTSGEVKIIKDIDVDIAGKDVLFVEDILDSGKTLNFLRQRFLNHNPKSIKLVTFLDKPARRAVPIQPDYSCFETPDEFIVGYGLDYAERYRNLPYVAILKREVYEK